MKSRRLSEEQLSLVTVDANLGVLVASGTCFPGVKVQRCTVHKLRNITNHWHPSSEATAMADMKRIIYAGNKKEAREEFLASRKRYQNLTPKTIACLEKDLAETPRFFDFSP